MTGAKKAALLGAWAAMVVAAFSVGRVTAPTETASAPEDFGAAIRAALGEQDAVYRAERSASVLNQLDPENVLEVAAVYDSMLNILDETDLRLFSIAWARIDPAAALDHVLQWQFKDKMTMGAGAVLESWAMRDPAAALEAYDATADRYPGISQDLFLDLLTGWVYSGGAGLDEHLAGLSRSRQDVGITRVAAKLVRNGGVEAVIRWVDSIVRNEAFENRYKKRVFIRGVRIVGRFDPERAAAWAVEHEGNGYAHDAPRIVAGRWGTRDGAAAMQWVLDHTSGEQTGQAMREAFRTWMESDRKSAVEWLKSETLTADHDQAVSFYAKDLSDRAPEEAIPWCEQLVDSLLRQHCLNRAAAEWYQRDAVAAETWLQQSTLDEEQRRTVRLPPDQRRRELSTRQPGPKQRKKSTTDSPGG